MATLTYNPDESQEGELTADEQDSLAVGEQLAQEESKLLAGKYKDAEDLEKAYIELQSKLGKNEPEAEQPQQQQQEEQEEEETSEVDTEFLDQLWNEAQADKFSQESFDRLKGMKPVDYLRMYFDYRSGVENNAGTVISNEEASELRGLVGGDEAYTQMTQWAGQNMSEQEIDMYDSIMNRGDKASMYFAMQALKARYTDGVGADGQLLTGKPARSQQKGFRSQAELVRAMSDPRYDNGPAYRADVAATLEASNIDF